MTALGPAVMVGAPDRPTTLRRVVVALLWLMVIANAVYLVGLIVSGGATSAFINIGASQATQWIPAAIFWLVATRPGPTRLPITLVAIGVTATALGDSIYSFAMDETGYLAFPSLADPAYLLFYPLMAAGLVVLVRRRLASVGWLVLLETAVATAGVSALLAVVLAPVFATALDSGTLLASAVAFAYPLFDLILIAVIAGIVSVPTERVGRRWWAVIIGLGLWVTGDITYALLENADAYLAGTPLDATWAVGLAFITWWAVGALQDPPEMSAPARHSVFSLPTIGVLAGLAVLVMGTQMPLSAWPIALAALTVALGLIPVVLRQVVLGRLLTAQQEAVRQLTELDQAKTDMLVTVNHEFRTPLTAINGHVDLLLDGVGGEVSTEARDMLQTIERNGAKLQALIDSTFASSRFDDLEDHFTPEPTNVAALVHRVIEHVEPLAQTRGVTLVVTGEDTALLVEADGTHLERALTSIVDNAVKFTDRGGQVTVAVTASPAYDEALIVVSDTGIGIPADDIPRLFTRFFRASNVQKAAIPGVGLGLSIAQQVVQAHGGTIGVESAVGGGTTMTVRLPASAP
jgi:signal transduction histidine kinase